jgi:hypothetical protein
MPGADHGEVPVVEGSDADHPEAFGDRYNRSVGATEREVPVCLHQFSNPWQIFAKDRDEDEPVIGAKLAQKPCLDHGSTPPLEQIADLRQHRVFGVDHGHKRTSVDDDHRSGGLRLAKLCAHDVLGTPAKIRLASVGDPYKAGAAGTSWHPRDEAQRLQRVGRPVLRDPLDELVQLLSRSHPTSVAHQPPGSPNTWQPGAGMPNHTLPVRVTMIFGWVPVAFTWQVLSRKPSALA